MPLTLPSKSTLLGILFVNLATMGWATNALLGRVLRNDIGPLNIAAIRFTIAAIFFSLLLRRRPPAERLYGRDRWWILAMSLTGVVLFSPILYLGLRFSTAVNSSLIFGVSPLMTALLAAWIIGQAATGRQVIGALAGLIGVAGILSGGRLEWFSHFSVNIGDVLFVCAALAWSLYSVFGKRVMAARSPAAATALSIYPALPILIIGAVWEAGHIPLHLTWQTLAGLAHITLVPTIASFWLWNRAVALLGPSQAMVHMNTLAFYGALLAALVLGEPVGPAHFIFGGLIIGGCVWASLEKKPAQT